MKKSILFGALLTIATATFAFKGKEDGNKTVETAFTRDFAQAKTLHYDLARDFVKVTFEMGNQTMFAYYTPNGELIAVTRYISTTQLPIALDLSLKTNYSSYWVTDLFELNASGETTYYVTIENGDSKIVLKSTENGWQAYSKSKK